MRRRGAGLLALAAASCLAAPTLGAEPEAATGLTPPQEALLQKVTRGELCPCGLPMSLARCLEREDACPRAREAAAVVAAEVRKGRGYAQVVEALIRTIERSAPRPKLDLAGRPRRGAEGARAVLVVFSDFECPHCRLLPPILDDVLAAFPGRLALVFAHFPLSFHENAADTAAAAEVAHARGRFWEFHDAAFEGQGDLSRPRLQEMLRAVGIDPDSVTEAEWAAARARVDADRHAGQSLAVSATPTLLLDGLELPVEDYEVDALKARVGAALQRGVKEPTGER